MSLRQFLASNLLLCIINIKFFFLSHLCCCPPLCTSGGQCERVQCLDQFLLVLIGRELRCTHVSIIFPVELIWRSAGRGKKEKKKGQTCDDRDARFMFKNPAVGVQGYEVTRSHPVRSPASYGSMRVCFAVPSLLSSLSLAFLLLPPAESLIVNQQQQSPSPPATFHILFSPWFIFRFLLPPTFPTRGCIWLQFEPQTRMWSAALWRGYSGKIARCSAVVLLRKSWCWVESSDGVNVEFLPCRWERLQFVGHVCVESRGPEVKPSLTPLPPYLLPQPLC